MSLQPTPSTRNVPDVAEVMRLAKGLETMQRFLTRQPILDNQDHVVGYELKRRDRMPVEVLPGAESMAQIEDEHLLLSAIDLNFQRALGNKLTFLSVSPETLLNPLVEQLPKDKVALALHPGGDLDPDVVARAEGLVKEGLILAADDLGDVASSSPLLAVSRYVRLDITRYDVMSLAEQVTQLQQGPGHAPLLIATQVETQEGFETCAKLGFELFQGYYFTQLEPSKPSRMDANVLRVMDLLNKIMERAAIDALEDTFKLDPALSYKLLRYINSPAIGLRTTIKSIGHALTLLGYDQTYRWLTLLLFSSVRATARNLALLRHDRMEPAQRGGLFLTGMFSLLDALLNVPMSQALANLNLPDSVANALIHGDGPYARYLDLATACERFDQDTIATMAADIGVEADTVNLAHVNALIWSESVEI